MKQQRFSLIPQGNKNAQDKAITLRDIPDIAERSRREYYDEHIIQIQEIDEGFYDNVVWPFIRMIRDQNIQQVRLVINTPGGNIAPMVQLIGLIRKSPKPVIAEIIQACSAGFMIAINCHYRMAYSGSELMYHQAWSGAVGNTEQIKRQTKYLEYCDTEFERMLLERTKISTEMLKEHRGHDWVMTPSEALKLGVIDEVVDTDYTISPEEVLAEVNPVVNIDLEPEPPKPKPPRKKKRPLKKKK